MLTHGTITHGPMGWRILANPHVRTRMRRVFARVSQSAGEAIRLTDNPENCRELEWFCERYPMAFEPPELAAKLAQRSKAHREAEQAIADILAGRREATAPALAKPLRAYQATVPTMFDAVTGLLLADDLGLGKTVSAIGCMVKPGMLPAVVVCQAHLPRQWAAMVREFAPELNVHIIKKGSVYELVPPRLQRQQALFGSGQPDVLIMSYHMMRGWADHLTGKVGLVVFDEAQALRRDGSQIHDAARVLAGGARARLGLSATPIYNYGGEFFNVLDVLAPDRLGSRDEFIREWCTSGDDGKTRLTDPPAFRAHLLQSGLMLQRTRAEVGRELPPLTKVVHYVDTDPKALAAIQGNAIALARTIVAANESYRGERMNASAEFDNLMRQATGVAKAPYVAEFVRMLAESGERIVLFGWHRAVYAIWNEALKDLNPVMFTGSESAAEKAAAVEAFKSGASKLLIMSLRSGAGVDGLQGVASIAVMGELDWSPQAMEQCIGRVHRDGQDSPCTAYFLVAEDGADPIMTTVLGLKRDQSDGVMHADRVLVSRVDTGETTLKALARDMLKRAGIPHETTNPVPLEPATA